ncbi:MAG TPA: dihydrofolate reductase [Pseudolysinimonas sp.]|nr:dihydrofolate reductase [Pseudolysinimonas sp.]
MSHRIRLIWAQAAGGVIGADGGMPWSVPEDMARFTKLTRHHPVVMGRRTWESFPERYRPLPDRRNIVVTRDEKWNEEGAEVAHSVKDALALAASDHGVTWVIGGSHLFEATIADAEQLEVTEFDLEVDGDTWAPPIDDSWQIETLDPDVGWYTSRSGVPYRFITYTRA